MIHSICPRLWLPWLRASKPACALRLFFSAAASDRRRRQPVSAPRDASTRARHFHALLVQRRGLLDVAGEHASSNGRSDVFVSAAEVAHRVGTPRPPIDDQRAFPEAERRVLLERRHAAEHPLVEEVRKAPLHRLLDVGARRVHRLANRRSRIGCANGAAFLMCASTRGSLFPSPPLSP